MKRYLIPLGIFIVLVGFLAVGLQLNPREVPSPLIDKPAPPFTLPQLADPQRQLSQKDLLGGLGAQRGVVVRFVPRGTPGAGGSRKGQGRSALRPELRRAMTRLLAETVR